MVLGREGEGEGGGGYRLRTRIKKMVTKFLHPLLFFFSFFFGISPSRVPSQEVPLRAEVRLGLPAFESRVLFEKRAEPAQSE